MLSYHFILLRRGFRGRADHTLLHHEQLTGSAAPQNAHYGIFTPSLSSISSLSGTPSSRSNKITWLTIKRLTESSCSACTPELT